MNDWSIEKKTDVSVEEAIAESTHYFLEIGRNHASDSNCSLSVDSIDEFEAWIREGMEEIAKIEGFNFQWDVFKEKIEGYVISFINDAIEEADKHNNYRIEVENLSFAKKKLKKRWPDLRRFFESKREQLTRILRPKDQKEGSGSSLLDY